MFYFLIIIKMNNTLYNNTINDLSIIRKNTLYNWYYRDHDIDEVYDIINNFMNQNIEYWNLDSLLNRFMNKTEVQDIISDRIQNDWLYVIDRIKDVDLESEYFKFDWYEDLENIDYMDVIDRIDDILDELVIIKEVTRIKNKLKIENNYTEV